MKTNNDCYKIDKQAIIQQYLSYLEVKEFPCIAAKAALAHENVKCFVAGNMACPNDDENIINFLYDFVDEFKSSQDKYHSAAIIFTGPQGINEEIFDELLWQRLQAFEMLDAKNYSYDNRVDANPSSPKFSFSLKEEAFYIIGVHPESSRLARSFMYPAIVFNPHVQFEQLRATAKYDIMKNTVRKRDIAYSGTMNPMLHDFGTVSEVYQYSGRMYDENWQCPLKINHTTIEHNTTS